ncbi:unnamed protein product [Amoebophrya sp. A25]|nr:unnamed protein product [Amoebophrya sp. A25]|eukprot:GSA25T00009469001.1
MQVDVAIFFLKHCVGKGWVAQKMSAIKALPSSADECASPSSLSAVSTTAVVDLDTSFFDIGTSMVSSCYANDECYSITTSGIHFLQDLLPLSRPRGAVEEDHVKTECSVPVVPKVIAQILQRRPRKDNNMKMNEMAEGVGKNTTSACYKKSSRKKKNTILSTTSTAEQQWQSILRHASNQKAPRQEYLRGVFGIIEKWASSNVQFFCAPDDKYKLAVLLNDSNQLVDVAVKECCTPNLNLNPRGAYSDSGAPLTELRQNLKHWRQKNGYNLFLPEESASTSFASSGVPSASHISTGKENLQQENQVVPGGRGAIALVLPACWLRRGCNAPEDGFDTRTKFKPQGTQERSADIFCSGVSLGLVGAQRTTTKFKRIISIDTVQEHLRLALRAGYKPLISADRDYENLRRLAREAPWPTKNEVEKIEKGFSATGSTWGGKMNFDAIDRHCGGQMMQKICWYNVLRKLEFPFKKYGD